MAAWIVCVGAPFLVSFVPARLFVDWSEASSVVTTYRDELIHHINVDERVAKLRDTCIMMKDEKRSMQQLSKAKKTYAQLCGVVAQLPNGTQKIPTGINPFKWRIIDLSHAHKGCAVGKEWLDGNGPVQALEKSREICGNMSDLLNRYDEGSETMPDAVNYITDRLRSLAEAMISMLLALQSIGTLFPTALSIGPGLLKGAVRMKILVPQSIIPGMFVLVLPWLYCPLSWCMYSLFFQLIGNVPLLLGLIALAFSPVLYFFLGKYYELEKPMSDQRIVIVARKVNRALFWTSMFAFSMLGFVMVDMIVLLGRRHFMGNTGEQAEEEPKSGWGSEMEENLMQQVINYDDWAGFIQRIILTLLACLFSWLKSFFLTSIAGVDWMTGEMANYYEVTQNLHNTLAKEADGRMGQMAYLMHDHDKNGKV